MLKDNQKVTTLSMDSLNVLYFKFFQRYVLKYLPEILPIEFSRLLKLQSAYDVYKYLNQLLSNSQSQTKAKTFHSYANQKVSNVSQNDSNSYVQQEIKNLSSSTKQKSPPQLKRTMTYAQQQRSQKIQQAKPYVYTGLKFGDHNIVKHDFDTISDKPYHKAQSYESENNYFKFKNKKEEIGSPLQFQKHSYGNDKNIIQQLGATVRLKEKQNPKFQIQASIKSKIKKLKQIFRENQSKVQRYDKISTTSNEKYEAKIIGAS